MDDFKIIAILPLYEFIGGFIKDYTGLLFLINDSNKTDDYRYATLCKDKVDILTINWIRTNFIKQEEMQINEEVNASLEKDTSMQDIKNNNHCLELIIFNNILHVKTCNLVLQLKIKLIKNNQTKLVYEQYLLDAIKSNMDFFNYKSDLAKLQIESRGVRISSYARNYQTSLIYNPEILRKHRTKFGADKEYSKQSYYNPFNDESVRKIAIKNFVELRSYKIDDLHRLISSPIDSRNGVVTMEGITKDSNKEYSYLDDIGDISDSSFSDLFIS